MHARRDKYARTDTHARTHTNKHQTRSLQGRTEVSIIQSDLSAVCRPVPCRYGRPRKQMENSIRKPQGSNFTNAIFTLQA